MGFNSSFKGLIKSQTTFAAPETCIEQFEQYFCLPGICSYMVC